MCCSQVLVSLNFNARDMNETQNLKETGCLPMSVNFSVRLSLLLYTCIHATEKIMQIQYTVFSFSYCFRLSVSATSFCEGECFVWNVVLYVEGWQIGCWRNQGGRF